MKLTTTFWSKEVFEFDRLLYINGATKEILFEADLNDIQNTIAFFNNVSKFVKTANVRKTLFDDAVWYQFAVMFEHAVTPITWFNLVVGEKLTISHDIAFNTTLIHKNGIEVPFGKFPHWYNNNKKFSKYRELNIKNRAYKYIANKVAQTT